MIYLQSPEISTKNAVLPISRTLAQQWSDAGIYKRKGVVPLLLCAALASLASGCSSGEAATDAAFLRETEPPQQPLEKRDHSLFPVVPNSRLIYNVQTASQKDFQEETRIGTDQKVNNTHIVPLESLRNGATLRREVYQVDNIGLTLSKTGSIPNKSKTLQMMSIQPPMPLLQFPVVEGAYYTWSGKVSLGKAEIPAKGLTRISAWETITTKNGNKLHAYRVDTLISAFIDNRRIDFPSFRWFSPGIGIVRQKYLADRKQVVKTLIDSPVPQAETSEKKSGN